MRLKISLLLPLSLHPGKVNFLAVKLILLIYVFNKSFQVSSWFITHNNILFTVVKKLILWYYIIYFCTLPNAVLGILFAYGWFNYREVRRRKAYQPNANKTCASPN